MTEPGSHVPYPIGRSIGAIAMGALLALLGFLAGTAQGMSAAPSQTGPIVALAIIVVGIGLAVLGLASTWMPRFRLGRPGDDDRRAVAGCGVRDRPDCFCVLAHVIRRGASVGVLEGRCARAEP